MKLFQVLVIVSMLSLPAAAISRSFLGVDPRAFEGTMHAAGDATCASGLLSLPEAGQEWQVCCPKYCKSCTDYATCKRVNEQDSEDSCCASRIKELQCGHGAAANVCLHVCSKHGPPCIMDATVRIPEVSYSAADDCNEAVSNWRKIANSAMEAAKDQVKKNELIESKKALWGETEKEFVNLMGEQDASMQIAKDKYDQDNAKLEVNMRNGEIKGVFRDRQKKYVESIRTLMNNVKDAVKVAEGKFDKFQEERGRDMSMSGQVMTTDAAEDKLGPKMDDVRNAKAKLDSYLAENPYFPADSDTPAQDTFDNFFAAFGRKDLHFIEKDYSENSVLEVTQSNREPIGPLEYKGLARIKEYYTGLFESLTDTRDYEAPVKDVKEAKDGEPGSIHLTWSCKASGIDDASDTFTLDPVGKIQTQKIMLKYS